jgi:Tol biopolymer transport system component
MNKDFLNSLPADEQPAASKLNSLIDDLQLSPSFQRELEIKLMDVAQKKTRPARNWQVKILPAAAWALAAIGALLLLNWTIRSLASPAPAVAVTPVPAPSFEEQVRQGKICPGPLAVGHGFTVFLTNEDKTGFLPLDPEKSIGEMRSFAWSTDGSQLAIFGNTTGRGNIWLTDTKGSAVQPVLPDGELEYLMDGAWSRDGKKFVLWSSQDNKLVYLVNADGSTPDEKQLEMQILGTPQFGPDGENIVFYGADQNAAGLFEMDLGSSQVTLINPSVKDPSGYAFSPDGSRLAYMEYDRDIGEARLFTADLATGERTILGTMDIPKKSGASLPDAANLSWSADGKFIAFDFGQYASDRNIYLAPVNGMGLIKFADSGYAPAISADGKCLAYLKEKKVFLVDMNDISSNSAPAVPLFVAELPDGRGIPNYKQDKLQWRP